MPERRTIADIARLAGVSKATVSRVLNHKPDVDPLTRERVLRIVEEQGFVPSITASGLAGGRSRLIGVLVPAFTWPFIPDIVRGVAEVIANTSYELVLYSINDTTREEDKIAVIDRILATKLTAGLLAILPGPSSRYATKLHKPDFPVILIDDQEVPPTTPWVGADNYMGAYTAVRHLLNLGHRRIAHIQGPIKYLCSRERYQGYCQALREEGIDPDPTLVLEGDFVAQGGHAAAKTLFSLPNEKRPTAIFASSDLMAYGVMAAAEEHNLRIPGDLALVGFDDITSSAHVRPALTTVRQPFYEMGQRSITLLLSMLDRSRNLNAYTNSNIFSASEALPAGMTNGVNGSEPVHIKLATSLVVRNSCGSPRHLSLSTSELSL